MKLPLTALFEDKTTGQQITGWISSTTLGDVQSQGQWCFAADALDQEWNWEDIWLASQTAPNNSECYSAVIAGELHGLMSLDLQGRAIREGQALVVDFLATNPLNRIPRQGYKYIGICLLGTAVARSIELGMAGRIWLESLPHSKTLQFYQNIGMTKQPQRSTDGLDVFVFESKRALEFLTTATNKKWLTIKNPR